MNLIHVVITALLFSCITHVECYNNNKYVKFNVLTLNMFIRPKYITSSYWNGDYKEERMFDFISKFSNEYDIICIQEMFGAWSYRRDNFVKMMKIYGFNYHYSSSETAIDSGYLCLGKLGCFTTSYPFLSSDGGTIIFSKYRIIETNEINFSHSRGNDALARKGVIHAKILMEDESITKGATCNINNVINVYTAHLQAGSGTKEIQIKLFQLNELHDFVKEHSFVSGKFIPSIISGDFNINGLDKDKYSLFNKSLSLKNTNVILKDTMLLNENDIQKPTACKHANLISEFDYVDEDDDDYVKRLDYIFTQSEENDNTLKCISSKVEPFTVENKEYVRISDHYGVSATFLYQSKN